MPDQVASQLPSGAGRFQDFWWPNLIDPVGVNSTMRPRTGSATALGSLANIGGGSSPGWNVRNGSPVAQLTSGVAVNVGIQVIFYPGLPVMLRTSRSAISPAVDDCAVYRFVINMAGFGTTVGAGEDFGFEIVRFAGNGVGIRLDKGDIPGIGLRIQSANVVHFLVNGPLGRNFFALTAAPFDTTQLHSYDLRLFSATPTADARLTLRIDGAVQALPATMSDWGAPGSLLPPMQGTAGFVGFVPTLVSCAGSLNFLYVQQMHMCCAPSELMTL